MLGYANYHANKSADAQQVLETAARLFPSDVKIHEALARIRWINGAGPRFVDDFLAAVAAHPGDLALRLKCADLLRLSGELKSAERLLRDALAITPGDVAVQAWLAVLLDGRNALMKPRPCCDRRYAPIRMNRR